jgi:hypothetical protein
MSLEKDGSDKPEHGSSTSLSDVSDVDLLSYHEKYAGRLIIDLECVILYG